MDMKKLEKAYFYNSSQRDIIADIFWLTEKLYKARNTILVYCKDNENVKIIDDFLWGYQDDGFIPHSIKKEDSIIQKNLCSYQKLKNVGKIISLRTLQNGQKNS